MIGALVVALYIMGNWKGLYSFMGMSSEDISNAGPLTLILGAGAPCFAIGLLIFIFGTLGNHLMRKWQAQVEARARHQSDRQQLN